MSSPPPHPPGRFLEVAEPDRRAIFARNFLIVISIVLTFVTGWATGLYTWSEWGSPAARSSQEVGTSPGPPGESVSQSEIRLPEIPVSRLRPVLRPEPAEFREVVSLLQNQLMESPALTGRDTSVEKIRSLFDSRSYKMRLSAEPVLEVDPATDSLLTTVRENIAYWRPARFDDRARRRFMEYWSIWRSTPIDGLVIDLRFFRDGNQFEGAAALAGLFASPGQPLFSLEGLNFPQRLFVSERQPLEISGRLPMVVLVHGETRGAAEVFAALLRRHQGALLLGEPTAGEGGLYTETKLASGRFVRMATARATLPDGSALLGVSIKPDMILYSEEPASELGLFRLAQTSGVNDVIRMPVIPKRRADEASNPDPRLDDVDWDRPAQDEALVLGLDLIQALAIHPSHGTTRVSDSASR